MDDKQLKQYYIDLWASRKPTGLSHKKEDWDERAVDWVKELEEDEVRNERSAKRVAATAAFLRQHGLLKVEDTVIDIGCGPGRFVTEFAKTAGWVTGVDLSPNMCRFGLEYAHSEGVQNVDFVPCDFKTVDAVQNGWAGKYDLVFSSITPAMSTYESFRKAEQMSKAYCFQSNFVKISDPLGDEVLKEVLGKEGLPPERTIDSMFAMFNILCMEGCMPVVEYYHEISEEKETVDEHMVRKMLKHTALSQERKDAVKEQLREALLKRADCFGKVQRNTEWVYGWILWDVREKKA